MASPGLPLPPRELIERAYSTFLPQDRVSEFAQMTPQQLLRETQRAAGDEHLTAWHDTLISSGKERKELTEVCAPSAVGESRA